MFSLEKSFVPKTKLLGVILTDDLKWDKNTNELVKKAYSRMELLRKVASFTNSIPELRNIYMLYVRSMQRLLNGDMKRLPEWLTIIQTLVNFCLNSRVYFIYSITWKINLSLSLSLSLSLCFTSMTKTELRNRRKK